MPAGVATALAPPAVVTLVARMACVLGVEMTLPFKVQYAACDAAAVWMELPLVDQLSVVSCICRFVSTRACDADSRIPVLSSAAWVCLQLRGGVLAVHMVDSIGSGSVSVRMVGVGSFFAGSHLSFADGLDPQEKAASE